MNGGMKALIGKDFRSISTNRQLFMVLLVIPLVMAVVLPSIFILVIHFVPDSLNGIDSMLALLPEGAAEGGMEKALIGLILNNVIPPFFLLIPIMASSVMAASSFVGEKEKRTLETLLYSPLSLRQIFQAKIFASFGMSMMVSFISFAIMAVVVELELLLTLGEMILPSLNWLIVMLLVAPAVSMLAITLIVRGSAKAKTIEESQQRSVFLIMPVMLMAVGQFTGVLLVNMWLLLGFGLLLALAAWLLMRRSMSSFTYEKLLK